ncbi:Pentatricopeptide repeat-containing protein [Vitis vinifera]|uniref:Pentatricopeptide repeat-containing protein n=1 Tax=Vitis vinifera TaxID=29760 RepID=A0A438K4V4_VITVI|nr:Pentatricopeptide repeat-containing protein [Vitis vinifera]
MVGKRLINLQPCHSGRYILLSNIYAAAKKWDDARKVRNLMKVRHLQGPGVSVIELKGMVHRYREWLLDMEEEDKEHALAVHSEKLAIAYGYYTWIQKKPLGL